MQSPSGLSTRLNRRRLLTASGAAIITAPFVGIHPTFAQDAIVATMVTGTAGTDDESFNDLAKAGGDRAADTLGVEFDIIESEGPDDYVQNIADAAAKSDITIAIGVLLEGALAEVAADNPDKHFAIIDTVVEGENIVSYAFREQEGAFLAGILAASMTKTGTIGFLGGIRIPPVMRQEVGYIAGARSIDPHIKTLIAYADDFDDVDLGKELVSAQYNNDADIVLSAAGRTGVGAFDAARDYGEGAYIIATDQDQSQLGPEIQLAAVVKKLDNVVFDVIEGTQNGTFVAGAHEIGLAENGVDLAAINDIVPRDITDIIDAYSEAIASGTVIPPVDDDTLETFEPIAPDQLGATATPAT